LQLQNVAHNTRLDFQKLPVVRWCISTWTNLHFVDPNSLKYCCLFSIIETYCLREILCPIFSWNCRTSESRDACYVLHFV